VQGAVDARQQNYVSITKNLTFSTLPWYDMHIFSDQDDHMHRLANRIPMENDSDSASENERETFTDIDQTDLIQAPPPPPP
jgi:hypothetical protein